MTREARGTLAIIGSALGYSGLPILAKLALAEGVHVLPMVAWRFIAAAGALWLVVAVTRRRIPKGPPWPSLLMLGLLYAVSATAYLAGLQWVTASLATLVFFTYPAVVIVLAAAFLGERLTRPRVLATVLTILGCSLILGLDVQRTARPIGLLLIGLAVIFIAIYILWGKALLRDIPPFGAAAVSLLATAAVAAAAAAAIGGMGLGGGARGALWVVLMGVVSTAAPVALLLTGIRDIGPGQAAVLSTVEPLFTLVWASLLLGERITLPQYAGGAVLLFGVLWLRLQRPRLPPPGIGQGA